MIKKLVCRFFLSFFGLFRIQKKIIFSSFDGKNYGDNPKALFLALKEKYGKQYKYIWLMYDFSQQIEGAEVVKAYSIKALYHIATAKLWIHNSRQRIWMRKRKEQFYIQTWHGNIALKKIEKDAEGSLPSLYIQQAKNDSKMADLFIAGSKWNEQNYRDSFWYDGEILTSGLPRSDIFFENPDQNNKRINKIYGLADECNVVLYCPTFRNDEKLSPYFRSYNHLIESLEKSTGKKWAVFVRLHPNIQKLQKQIIYSDKILDGSKVTDMNELLIRSQIVITDYSSVMFDALMIKKKVFIYASDIESYNKERGQYFNLSELPFPLSQNEHDLINHICDEALIQKYEQRGTDFIDECGFYETGEACKKVLKRLENVL